MQEFKALVKPSNNGLRIITLKITRENGYIVVADKVYGLNAVSEKEMLKNIGFHFSQPQKPNR